MAKSDFGVYVSATPETVTTTIQMYYSSGETTPELNSEFQSITNLLAQKIQDRANNLPHPQKGISSPKAAEEEESASPFSAAPPRARKF